MIDYGMGNLASVLKGLERAGGNVELTDDRQRILAADGVVLPGVGAFGQCVDNLRAQGLDSAVREVIDAGQPFLGICLGLQVLFESSEESPGAKGLGVFEGAVRKFPPGLHVPHMGWNQVEVVGESVVLEGIKDDDFFYFVHSYYVDPADPALAATRTDYSLDFVSSVRQGSLFACQFHPEKSQRVGLRLLRNFVALVQAGGAGA